VKKPCKKQQETTQERKAGCPYKEGCSAFLSPMVTNEKRHEKIGIHYIYYTKCLPKHYRGIKIATVHVETAFE